LSCGDANSNDQNGFADPLQQKDFDQLFSEDGSKGV